MVVPCSLTVIFDNYLSTAKLLPVFSAAASQGPKINEFLRLNGGVVDGIG